MLSSSRRAQGRLTAVAVFLAASVAILHASGPRVIRAEGKLLKQPIVMSDWRENADFYLTMGGLLTTPLQLADRPYVELSFFWPSNELNAYLDAGKPAADLRPQDAAQHAWFYPARGDAPPVLLFSGSDRTPEGESTRRIGLLRWLSPEALDFLGRHGIPTRVPATPN